MGAGRIPPCAMLCSHPVRITHTIHNVNCNSRVITHISGAQMNNNAHILVLKNKILLDRAHQCLPCCAAEASRHFS